MKYQHCINTISNPQEYTVKVWLDGGLDRKKLILGFPLYGQSFTLADADNHGLNSQTYGGAEAGKYTKARGFLSYYEVKTEQMLCWYIEKGLNEQ